MLRRQSNLTLYRATFPSEKLKHFIQPLTIVTMRFSSLGFCQSIEKNLSFQMQLTKAINLLYALHQEKRQCVLNFKTLKVAQFFFNF